MLLMKFYLSGFMGSVYKRGKIEQIKEPNNYFNKIILIKIYGKKY